MSKENLEQFMNQIADSEELQAKIGEEIDAEALIALGAECGCEFTAEELQESAELSDEELDGVAGGGRMGVGGWFRYDDNGDGRSTGVRYIKARDKVENRHHGMKPGEVGGFDNGAEVRLDSDRRH